MNIQQDEETKVDVTFKVAEAESEIETKTQSRIPTSLDERVIRALAQQVDKEAMRMVPSLAKEMAKNGWQADLDAFRLMQAARLGTETLKTATQAMSKNNRMAQDLITAHPELEADVAQMLCGLNEVIKQLPTVGVVAYTARYFKNQ